MRRRLNITLAVEENPNAANRHQKYLARATMGVQMIGDNGAANGIGGHITADLAAGSERAAITRLGAELLNKLAKKLAGTSTT